MKEKVIFQFGSEPENTRNPKIESGAVRSLARLMLYFIMIGVEAEFFGGTILTQGCRAPDGN
jgi:hypothetical protein